MSQHITPMTLGSCLGSYFHLMMPSLARSTAKTLLGNGVEKYIVSPMTIGAPSCPRSTPVDMVQATWRSPTLSRVIWSSSEKRVLA